MLNTSGFTGSSLILAGNNRFCLVAHSGNIFEVFICCELLPENGPFCNEVNVETDMSESKVVQFKGSCTEPQPVNKLVSLNLFKVLTLFGHPPSLHPIYKRPKGLFSVNAFYMKPFTLPV